MTLTKTIATLCLVAAAAVQPAMARKNPATGGYVPRGDCGGLPMLSPKVADGWCLALAATGLGTPRGVLPLADGRVLVADMGSWDRGRGRLLVLTRAEGKYTSAVLLTKLNRPHGLQLGPDGKVWLAEDDRIVRFDPAASQPVLEPVIPELPGDGEHPLKSFVFGRDGAAYVGVGTLTNNCETGATGDSPKRRCDEAEGPAARGAVWRFAAPASPPHAAWTGEVWARGLRNSMALAVHPDDGAIWQGENARDNLASKLPGKLPDDDTPRDELNRLVQGKHYGWPYCYDFARPSPEFPQAQCRRYEPPTLLLPAHAAPLSMLFLQSPKSPEAWRRTLVVAFHGYRKHGHRIVGYSLDATGRPFGSPRPLVDEWSAVPRRQPMGAPTDLKVDANGALWITEDRNGTLLVLTPTAAAPKAATPATPTAR